MRQLRRLRLDVSISVEISEPKPDGNYPTAGEIRDAVEEFLIEGAGAEPLDVDGATGSISLKKMLSRGGE